MNLKWGISSHASLIHIRQNNSCQILINLTVEAIGGGDSARLSFQVQESVSR